MVFSLFQVCDQLVFCFCQSGPFFGREGVVSCCHLHLCRSTIYPCVSFWELGPQDLESCRSSPLLRERNFALFIPIIVQRVLWSVAKRLFASASSRRRILKEEGMFFTRDVQFSEMYFMVTSCFSSSFSYCSRLSVQPFGHREFEEDRTV